MKKIVLIIGTLIIIASTYIYMYTLQTNSNPNQLQAGTELSKESVKTITYKPNPQTMESELEIPYVYIVHPDSFTLTQSEVADLFSKMTIARKAFNVSPGSLKAALPLSDYIYSITKVNYGEGEQIAVRGFPVDYQTNPNWHLTEYDDGGQQYLDADFDFTTKEILYFSTHGEA